MNQTNTAYEDLWAEWLLEENRKPKRSHWPSDVTACRRQLWYKWKGTPKTNPPTAANHVKMKFGHVAEYIMRDFLDWLVERKQIANYDEQVYIDVNFGHEHPVHGKIDAMVRRLDIADDVEDIGPEIWEFKSTYGRGVKAISEGGPKPDHLDQIFMYMVVKKVRRGMIWYLGRDNGLNQRFEIRLLGERLEWKPAWWQTWTQHNTSLGFIVARLTEQEMLNKNATPPARDYLAAIRNGEIVYKFQRQKKTYECDWQCNYCDWKDLCWTDALQDSIAHATGFEDGTNKSMFINRHEHREGGKP